MYKDKGNFSHLSWDDVYFSGMINERIEGFCEDTQEIVDVTTSPHNQGWGFCEEDEYIEDNELEWYMKMNQGKIKRK